MSNERQLLSVLSLFSFVTRTLPASGQVFIIFFPQLEPLNGITTPSLWLLSLAEHCGSFWLKRKTEN